VITCPSGESRYGRLYVAVIALPLTSIVSSLTHSFSSHLSKGGLARRFEITLALLRSGPFTEHLIMLNMGRGLPSPAQANSAVSLSHTQNRHWQGLRIQVGETLPNQ